MWKNARDIIISYCEDDNILMKDDRLYFVQYRDAVNIRIDDYIISTIDRLNRYLNEDRVIGVDMLWEGMKHV